MTIYIIKYDPRVAVTVIIAPGASSPNRLPDFPAVGLRSNKSDWTDYLVHLFVGWAARFPKCRIIASIEDDGKMTAWLECP